MTAGRYTTVADVFQELRDLRTTLEELGCANASISLAEVLNGFWNTGSEALIEALDVLLEIEQTCGDSLDQECRGRIDEIRAGTKALLDFH